MVGVLSTGQIIQCSLVKASDFVLSMKPFKSFVREVTRSDLLFPKDPSGYCVEKGLLGVSCSGLGGLNPNVIKIMGL